jgi:hypothetical protein
LLAELTPERIHCFDIYYLSYHFCTVYHFWTIGLSTRTVQ